MISNPLSHFGDYSDKFEFGILCGPNEELLDFRIYGIKDFGIYADDLGIIDMSEFSNYGISAEVEPDQYGFAWTPVLEITPENKKFIQKYGRPYHGLAALSDDGEQYVFDANLGFFKKLFRGIKNKVKNVAQKVLKKIPGGKYLMKLGAKVWKLAKKYVKPLVKLVGKWAPRLAPIAALIPGVGPAVSAAMLSAGAIAKLMDKYGTKIVNIKNEISRLKFPSDEKAKQFQKDLSKTAKVFQRRGLDKKFLKNLERKKRTGLQRRLRKK